MARIITPNERFFKWAPIQPGVCWASLAAVLAAVHFLLAFISHSEAYAIAALAESSLIFLAGWAPIYVARKLENLEPAHNFMIALPHDGIQDWLHSHYVKIFSPKWIFGWGIALPLITLQAHVMLFQAHKGSLLFKIYDSFLGLAALYLCCATLMIYPRILIQWNSLKRLPIRGVAILSQSRCIGIISLTATIFSFIITTAFCLMMVVLLTGPTRFGVADYIYVGIGSSVCLICFIIPQWILHTLLRLMKNRLLEEFDGRLEAVNRSLSDVRKEPSPGNAKTLSDLLALHDRIERINEWPLSPQSVTGLLSSVFFPIIVSLLKKHLGA
jgi:hypothetical protein